MNEPDPNGAPVQCARCGNRLEVRCPVHGEQFVVATSPPSAAAAARLAPPKANPRRPARPVSSKPITGRLAQLAAVLSTTEPQTIEQLVEAMQCSLASVYVYVSDLMRRGIARRGHRYGTYLLAGDNT